MALFTEFLFKVRKNLWRGKKVGHKSKVVHWCVYATKGLIHFDKIANFAVVYKINFFRLLSK